MIDDDLARRGGGSSNAAGLRSVMSDRQRAQYDARTGKATDLKQPKKPSKPPASMFKAFAIDRGFTTQQNPDVHIEFQKTGPRLHGKGQRRMF